MRTLRFVLPLAVCLALVPAAAFAAATIVIVNNDGAGEGFNDPTPAAPVGGNAGTTIGQQRLIVFQQAASIWGSLLTSPVTIQVRSQFNPQTCTPTSAVLGSAGPVTVHRDFAGNEYNGTWYHQALGNKQAGLDLSVQPDINATFNSNLDGGACLGGTTWYYGLDGNEGTKIELLPVLLHEMGHGLGFSTLIGASGALSGGFPDVFSRFAYDETVNNWWYLMTQGQRAASAINTGNLAWDGLNVNTTAATTLAKRLRVVVTAPGSIAGEYVVGGAEFGPQLGSVTGDVALLEDGIAPINDGCNNVVNPGALAGKIALVDRGNCTFKTKVLAAQNAGAIAVLVANNVGGVRSMGDDPAIPNAITIPSLMITQALGTSIKNELLSGTVTLTMNRHPTFLAGATNNGRVQLYAPNPYEGGSSVSHWDTGLSPNALMEPFINNDLSSNVDLTLELFRDIGWFFGATATNMANFFGGETEAGYLLQWQVGDGTVVDGFRVSRGAREDGVFEDLAGMLPADAGTYLDHPEPGVWFYRIEGLRGGQVVADAGPYRAEVSGGVRGVEFAPPAPNPSHGPVTFDWAIPSDLNGARVELGVFDVGGRRVASLFSGAAASGRHSTTWAGQRADGGAAGAGVYFARLTTPRGVESRRIMLAR